jgi:exonuclease SbcC
MIPRRLRLKGFMSYRDETTISFEGSSIWAICGANGAGKSTLFDAICFALYGESRLGRQNHQELIHHQASELLVEFDFSVGAEDYRVRRTLQSRRPQGQGRSTHQAWRLVRQSGQESWQPVPGTDGKSDLTTWVQRLLGLDSRSFTFSVLLRQGKSDALLTAEAPERHALLGQIIDLAPYEQLHKRASSRQKEYDAQATLISQQLASLPLRQEEEIRRLEAQLQESERLCQELNGRQLALARLHTLAQQWERLQQERANLQAALADYDQLLSQADQIERNAARLEKLEQVLPTLRTIQTLACQQEQIQKEQVRLSAQRSVYEEYEGAIETLAELRQTLDALGAFARERESWRQETGHLAELEQQREHNAAALARLQEERARLLAERDMASVRLSSCTQERVRCETLLNESRERLRRFSEIDGAQVCRYCGQPLTAEHLERERQRLTAELEQARQAHQQAVWQEGEADQVYQMQRQQLEQLERDVEQCREQEAGIDRQRQQARHRQALAEERAAGAWARLAPACRERIVGVPNLPFETARALQTSTYPEPQDLDVLQKRCQGEMEHLLDLQRQADRQADDLADLAALRRAVQTDGARIRDQLIAIERDLRHCQQRIGEALAALPADWCSLVPDLSAEQVADCELERQRLQGARERLQELTQARYQRAETWKRLQENEERSEQVPLEARRPSAELAHELEQARRCYEQQSEQVKAQTEQLALQRQQLRQRQQLEAQLQEKETLHRRYRRLATLLDREHLQYYLIQQAERGIIYHANDVLKRLSGGGLQLVLPPGAGPEGADGQVAGEHKALELRVVNHAVDAHHPEPVRLLGGGQQFRIAVSLALAIGRYAGAGDQQQRIEAVMIDEGFGSLDEQGRAEIIHILREFEGVLKRIVVISHQREFFDEFEHKYYVELKDGSSSVSVM